MILHVRLRGRHIQLSHLLDNSEVLYCTNLLPLTHQYHVASGYVHVGLSWLFAPGWGGAVGGRRAVLWSVTELRGNAADTRRVRTPSSASPRAHGGPRRAPADTANTVLAAQRGFGRHVLPT